MAGELNLKHSASGVTVKALILGGDRSTRWNGTAMVAMSAVSDANWATGMIACAEQQTSTPTGTATYVGDFPAGLTAEGEFAVEFYVGAAPSPGDAAVGLQTVWWTGIKAASPVENVFHARILLTVDADNSRDEYSVRWFKNAAMATGGITAATIQVVKRSDGSDLVAAAAMTQIGSGGGYKYDEPTNRITPGEAVEAIVSATIDGAVRTWSEVLGRDSQ